ncbi:retropepsin-like aspartic protease family protein [Dentiradicibacter hellwigii]|uniref:TIGR02281 family clan AA aspartic protease n=1 Tax=Dentiradicibacter hellwigii TaxID=3149053 RepID=A0ABV4UEQ0_9RHOO
MPSSAADVGLVGIFPGKALLTINGGAPRTVAVGGKTADGVKVLAAGGDTATIEVDGKKRVLRIGQNVTVRATAGGRATTVLTADGRGHFLTTGSINGASMRFLVDTGASTVAMGASDARRAGVDPTRGEKGFAQTANGVAEVSRVRLHSVRVGDIVLNDVEATVHSQDMPMVLLGMSFLNRMEMQRNGDTMTLRKNY